MAGMTLKQLLEVNGQRGLASPPMLDTGVAIGAVSAQQTIAVNCNGATEIALVPIDLAPVQGNLLVIGHVNGRPIVLARLTGSAGAPTPPPTQAAIGVSSFPAIDARTYAGTSWRADTAAIAQGAGTTASTRTNLAINPGYEIGTNCYFAANTGTNWPITADTSQPIAGTKSAMTTRAAANPNTIVGQYVLDPKNGTAFPVTPGSPITLGVSIKTDAPGAKVTTQWIWFDSAFGTAQYGTMKTQVPSMVAGTVYRMVDSATPPAGAALGQVYVTVSAASGNAVTGQRVWMDQLSAEYGTTAGDYFDGSTPSDLSTSYAWSGTPNASQSTATTVAFPANTGAWFYGATPRSALPGATITQARIRVRRRSGGSTAAQTVNVYPHSSDTRPSGNVARVGTDGPATLPLQIGLATWVTLPVAWGQRLISTGGGLYIAGGNVLAIDGTDVDPQSGLLELTWSR
jgi:hypothetical protein